MRREWNQRLAAEGLGEIDFTSRSLVPSSAAYHQDRTTTDKNHFRDPESLALIREILAEYRLPTTHRAILHAFANGDGVRQIAQRAGVSKDTVHRLVLRYVGNEGAATVAEVSTIAPRVSLDARRTQVSKGTSPGRRPLSASETTAAYFELGQEFAEGFEWQWLLDRDVWGLHIRGLSQIRIGRELGMADTTVQRALERVRRGFREWLVARAKRQHEQDDSEQIRAEFEAFTKRD
jgi:DNA-directed RNA polymerase specialized sigma24 family protein